jgi:PAS domain S-box-containing protein
VTGVSPEARGATRGVKALQVDKSAVYGANAFITLIARYVIRRSKVGDNAKVFRTKRQALNWLMNKQNFPRMRIARLIALLVLLCGVGAIVGWYTEVKGLRSLAIASDPIHPAVALTFVIVGSALFLLTLRKKIWARISASWVFVFGLLVLLHAWPGFTAGIDTWPAWLTVNRACPPSIAILFVLMGVGLWLASYPLRRKLPSMLFRIAVGGSVVLIFALLVILGLDLTEDRVLSTLIILLLTNAALILITYRKPGRFPIARKIIMRYGLGIGIFIVIATVTLFAWQRARQVQEESVLNRTADAIVAKVDANLDILRGYKAFFGSSVFVDSSEFDYYFTSSGLRESNPELVSIGFLQREPGNATTFPITYVTPETDKANYGANFGSDPGTLQLLEKARDTGDIVSSDDVRNPPLVKDAQRHQLLIATAIYASGEAPVTVQDRREQLQGFVVAEFDHEIFFSHFFSEFPADRNIALVITDVHDGDVLYRSPAAHDKMNVVESDRVITVANHSWKTSILKNEFGERGLLYGPNVILLAGMALGVVTALLVSVLVRRRHEALRLADAITDDLEVERTRALQIAQKDDAIIASIGDGLIVTDGQGRVVLVNDRFTEMLGWSLDEVKGRHLADIVTAIDRRDRVIPKQQRSIASVLRDKVKVSVSLTDELRYMRKDGSAFPVAYTITPIKVEGKITGVVEIFRDISVEANIDRAKTEFVSLASHQLRTPLTSAKWYSELILEAGDDELKPTQKEYVRKVHGAIRRTIQLVSSLLNLSRIDMGSIEVIPESIDIIALAREVVKDLSKQIDQRQIIMHEEFSHAVIVAKVDPRLMHIVLENLLTNAIKYSPAKATVTLSISKGKVGTLICVRDTGYGIPKHQQDKIFTKLFRADNIKTKNTEGTGLGLYLVRSIVEYTGGEIWFESVENEGSSFFVRIPPSGMKKVSGSTQVIDVPG